MGFQTAEHLQRHFRKNMGCCRVNIENKIRNNRGEKRCLEKGQKSAVFWINKWSKQAGNVWYHGLNKTKGKKKEVYDADSKCE